MFRLRSLLLPAAGLLLALVVACGGGDKSNKSVRSDDNSGSGAYGSSQASGNSGSSQSGNSGGSQKDSLNLSASASKLMDLRSFRFDMNMKMDLGSAANGSSGSAGDALGDAFASVLLGALGDIKMEGSFVKPDQMDMRMKMSGQELGFVQIGKKAWVKFGGSWQETDADSNAFSFSDTSDLFSDFLPSEALKGAKVSQEKMNGVDATHYAFDKKALESMSKDLASSADLKELTQANLDVWMNSDNIPVKILMDFAGKDDKGQKMGMKLEMNIRDINSDSIKIKAPI
jgi:hypothetical protein